MHENEIRKGAVHKGRRHIFPPTPLMSATVCILRTCPYKGRRQIGYPPPLHFHVCIFTQQCDFFFTFIHYQKLSYLCTYRELLGR